MELSQAITFLRVETPASLIIEWLPGQGSEYVSMAELVRVLKENTARREGKGSLESLVLVGFCFDLIVDFPFSDLAYSLNQMPALKKIYFYDCRGQDASLIHDKKIFDKTQLNFFDELSTRFYKQTESVLTYAETGLQLGTKEYFRSLQGCAIALINSLFPAAWPKYELQKYGIDHQLHIVIITALQKYLSENGQALMFCGSLPEEIAPFFDRDPEAFNRLISRVFSAIIIKQKIFLETECHKAEFLNNPQAVEEAIILLNFTRCFYYQLKVEKHTYQEERGHLFSTVETLCHALQQLRSNPWSWFNPKYQNYQKLQEKEASFRSTKTSKEVQERVQSEKKATAHLLLGMMKLVFPGELIQPSELPHFDPGYYYNKVYEWSSIPFDFSQFYFNESKHLKPNMEKIIYNWVFWPKTDSGLNFSKTPSMDLKKPEFNTK